MSLPTWRDTTIVAYLDEPPFAISRQAGERPSGPPAAPRRSSNSSKTAASKPLKEKRQAKKEKAGRSGSSSMGTSNQ